MKVVGIRYAGRAPVYNMEVRETNNYAIENGTIVHNCRYLLMENPISPRAAVKPEPKPVDPFGRNDRPIVFR